MPVLARCTCGKSFQAKSELAGKRVKCPSCGGTFVVPVPPVESVSPDDPLGLGDLGMSDPAWDVTQASKPPLASSPLGGSRTLPAKPSSARGISTKTILLICAAGGFVLLLLVALLLGSLLFVGSDRQEQVAAVATVDEAAPAPTVPTPAPSVPAPSMPAPAMSAQAPVPGSSSVSAPTAAAATPAAQWSATADPPQVAPAWPDQLDLSISIPSRCDRIIYPATPSPYAVTGLNITGGDDVRVWNLTTGEQAGQIQAEIKSGSEPTLSPDGKLLVVKAPGGAHYSKVQVWSFETGQLLREIECDDSGVHLKAARFIAPELLFVHTFGSTGSGTRYGVGIWNATSGQRLREFDMGAIYPPDRLKISPGGRYLAAMASNNTLSMFDLETAKSAGEVKVDRLLDGLKGSYRGMSFSPDGKFLGLVYSDTNSSLILLDVASGTLAERIEIAGKPPTASAYQGASVEWLADKGWCLFGGTVVDRNTRRVVWNLDLPIIYRLTARRTLPGGWVVPTGPYSSKRLRFVSIPWGRIDAGLTGLQGGSAAMLKPGMSVSLDIQIGKLRSGTKEDTAKRLAEIFEERFAADKISVADSQSAILKARYAESEGETLHERQGFAGPATGRTVQATNIEVAMELVVGEQGRVLWSDEIAYAPRSVTIRGDEVNEATARDSIFRMLLYKLSETAIPYFVSQDDGNTILPGVTVLTDEGAIQ